MSLLDELARLGRRCVVARTVGTAEHLAPSAAGGRRADQLLVATPSLLEEAVRAQLRARSSEAARPSLIPSLCTRFTRAGIVWRR